MSPFCLLPVFECVVGFLHLRVFGFFVLTGLAIPAYDLCKNVHGVPCDQLGVNDSGKS